MSTHPTSATPPPASPRPPAPARGPAARGGLRLLPGQGQRPPEQLPLALEWEVAPGIPAGGAVRVSVATPVSYWPAGACAFVPGVGSSAVTCTPPVGTTVLALGNLRVVSAQ